MLSGHKEAITSISIHPSGKLALSVSKDNTMKLWNLVQGNTFCCVEGYPGSYRLCDNRQLSAVTLFP